MRIDPEYPRIHESLAEVLLRRARLGEARMYLRKAIDEEPYSWSGHFLLGTLHGKKKEWEEALDSFTTCVDIDPNEPRGWLKCGEAMLNLKRLEESERYLRKALELNPTMTDAIVEFGYLELERGDLESAEEFFEQVLSIDPGHKKALAGSRSVRRTTEGRKS
jgi:tetratricopeptide (TPR) repeat protein